MWLNLKSRVGYNLKKFSFWELECPDNLNVADEDDQVGDEGADDEYHLCLSVIVMVVTIMYVQNMIKRKKSRLTAVHYGLSPVEKWK